MLQCVCLHPAPPLFPSPPPQAAQEFVVQAECTERRWSRALQHELSARAQLQENMEKLAKEMHGLEAEARRSFPKEEM